MIVYVSKTKDTLNRKELNTEVHSDYICLNPKYPNVTIKKDVRVLIDSGAFQDTEAHKRVSFDDALKRQLELEKRVGLICERIVAYDFIGDSSRTMDANRYLVSKREELKPRQIVLMVQGCTVGEYKKCLQEALEIAKPFDCIGFGGVALAGKDKRVRGKLVETLWSGIPAMRERGVKDVHLFGLGAFGVLRDIDRVFRSVCECFNVSCDTSTIEIASVMGRVLNPLTEKWERVYTRADKYVNYHPCDLMHSNIKKALEIARTI